MLSPLTRPASLARLLHGHALEALFDAFVHITQTFLKAQRILPDHGKAEMPRLDDARMHRAHRNLMHALSFHLHERISVSFVGAALYRIKIFAQRKTAAVPRTVAQPFAMVLAFVSVYAEQVICGALHAVSHRKYPTDIGVVGQLGGQRHV